MCLAKGCKFDSHMNCFEIMKNLFQNAYFGKAYKTRSGSKAIFLKRKEITNYYILLVKSDFDFKRIIVSNDGKHFYKKYYDIVSEYEE